jgi:peptidoglycan hydrolase CwlO-like protein
MQSYVSTLRSSRSFRVAATCVLAALVAAIPASPSRGDLASSYAAGQQRASDLQSAINAENSKIQGFEGTIASLQARLTVIQQTVTIQQHLLDVVRLEWLNARARLADLRSQFARDQHVLGAQLLAQYEAPPSGIVDVLVDSRGFDDLLNRLNDMRTIERQNADTIHQVDAARQAVTTQTRRLEQVVARRQRATAAVLVERDQVVQLKLSIVNRELAVAHARAQDTSKLNALQNTLAHEAAQLNQAAATAQAASFGNVAPPPGGCVNTPFVAHGGQYGLFLASGTDYTVNEEPVLAARLDQLGTALQLHLIGISGYRTPQHSVEVGGFADDPHTRGLASDTPGVEGVPESTLEQYCLTRPFPGAAEADHIQELGSPR